MATIRKRRDLWQAQIRKNGHPAQSRSFATKREAEAWARGTEAKLDKQPPTSITLKGMTVRDLVTRYRDTVSVAKRGHRNEAWALNAFLRYPIADTSLLELRREDFAAYRDQRLNEVKPGSLKRQTDLLHHVFEVARTEWGLPIHENPLSKLRLSASRKRERRLKDGELERLREATRECRNSYVLPLILFANETGMRRGEILNVRWSHINGDTLLIPETKNGHARVIPLTKRARVILTGLREDDGERPFPTTASALSQAWRRLRRRAGIPDLNFHDLRHEAISRFFELNLTVPEVASISGHRDARMLLRYAHARKDLILAKLDG